MPSRDQSTHTGDLRRYLYASCFARAFGRSPTLVDFPIELLPNHENARDALDGSLFADRFRVQLRNRPATTVTKCFRSRKGHRRMMMIRIDLAGLRRTKWQDYAIRFLFGGLITAAAGLIAQRWGPNVGGLFLAFPAIFPASATLVEKHEKQKKNRAGLRGAVRGREAAALDAAGAALGCIGLAGFALVIWQLLGSHETWIVLGGAGLLWLGISGLCWRFPKLG